MKKSFRRRIVAAILRRSFAAARCQINQTCRILPAENKVRHPSSDGKTRDAHFKKSMSGRGRGRGRGRGAPPSGAKLLLMRSAQESGLGDHNLKSLSEITKPALFPQLIWNYQDGSDSAAVSKTRQSSTVYMINKGREIDHRIQTSSHWVRPSQTQVDVVRYQSEKKSHRVAQLPSDQAILEQMGKNLAADDSYTPAELVPFAKRRRTLEGGAAANDSTNKKPSLEELEKNEILKKREEARKANQLEEEGEGNFSDPAEESEEEVEDYAKDYYASEEESDGGGDAEATF